MPKSKFDIFRDKVHEAGFIMRCNWQTKTDSGRVIECWLIAHPEREVKAPFIITEQLPDDEALLVYHLDHTNEWDASIKALFENKLVENSAARLHEVCNAWTDGAGSEEVLRSQVAQVAINLSEGAA